MKMSQKEWKALKEKKRLAYKLDKPILKVPSKFKKDFHLKEIEALKSQFEQYDVTGDGSIDADELASIFKSLGENITPEKLEELIKEVDVNNSRAIEFDEFVTLMHNMRHGKNSKLGLAMIEAGFAAKIAKERSDLERDPVPLVTVKDGNAEDEAAAQAEHEDQNERGFNRGMEGVTACQVRQNESEGPNWLVEIKGPLDTAYEGGVWHMRVRFGETYPYEPPSIVMENRIHHINMPTLVDGASSLQQVVGAWDPSWRVRRVLENIVRVLRDPDVKMALLEQRKLEAIAQTSGNAVPRCASHNTAILHMYQHDPSRFHYYAKEYTSRFARPRLVRDEDDSMASSVTSIHHHHRDEIYGMVRCPTLAMKTTRLLEPGHLYFFPVQPRHAGVCNTILFTVTGLGAGDDDTIEDGVNGKLALFEEHRLQRSRIERKMDKSLKFHMVRVPNSMPTEFHIGSLQEEVEVDVFDQNINIKYCKPPLAPKKYYIGVVLQDEVEIECCTAVSTDPPYKHYNFEFSTPEVRWRAIDMCGLNRTHPFTHEDCIMWAVAMKVAIPTHHQHGMHSGNTAILEKYKQEQEALRQKLAQQNLVGSGSGSGGSTGSGISSSGSVGTGGMVASATAPGGLSLKSIPSKSPNQAKSAHDT